MSVINVQGQGLIGGTLVLPRMGIWHLDATVDGDAKLSGRVSITIGDALTLSGTVLEGFPYTETGYYRILGGAAGLSKLATPAAFGSCQLRQPLRALLAGVGESIDASADPGVLGVQLSAWSILGVSGGRQLAALLQAAPASTAWRVLPNGNFWFGPETWPDANIDYEEQGQLPHEGRLELTTEEPTLLPGTTLGGRHVSYVEHRIDSGKLRTLCLLEAA